MSAKNSPSASISAHGSLDAVVVGDRIGLFTASLCAIHCALVPVLLAMAPALGMGFSGAADIDQAFVVFASVLGITTVAIGYRRHRVLQAVWFLVAGLVLLWAGSFTPLHDHGLGHAVLMTLGGVLLAMAHFWNLRLTHHVRQRKG